MTLGILIAAFSRPLTAPRPGESSRTDASPGSDANALRLYYRIGFILFGCVMAALGGLGLYDVVVGITQ
jgi:hypothetical protein